ncbi:amidohydrolase family protein [Sphingomonas sp. QA11]|uniref:amidohydrolase family protein n=1 Tax=Sphingomonas sp. QA11 TaxID=2950605 RepID=UPI002349EBAB|nr:amidohydrolase family protein [Sphingomonas sp. QA11]WCM28548.1 amidohydrolase family protein [Sphingomonas sp. QA11]
MKIARIMLSAAMLLQPFQAGAREQADVLIRHATVIDVEHARTIPDQAIATRGEKIVAVGDDAEVAKAWGAGREVDGKGRFLIPGLWDMHMHFGGGPDLAEENKALLPLYVAYGITTIRDCAGDMPYDVLGWRQEIADGKLFGPRLLTSGPKIEGIKPVWKGTLETGSEADVDAAVAKLAGLKVDFVKITDSTLKPELFLYAVGKVRAAGLRASGHIPMALTVGQAVDAGISSIEHLSYAYKAGVKDEARIAADFGAGRIDRAQAQAELAAGFDPATAMASYARLRDRGVFVTPTLNIERTLAYLDSDDHSKDAFLGLIGPGIRKTYQWRIDRSAKATPGEIEARHQQYQKTAAVMPMLEKAGVTIMAGTDAGFLNSFDYPGLALHQELALYVKNGLSPAGALAAATRAGPKWFGVLDRYGSVEKGKQADLLLLDRNPLEDISATQSIDTVILRGAVQDRTALDRLLAEARAKVARWDAEMAK